MKNLLRNKKAVSPVVATMLLIALTVSAAAIIYFVVVPMLNKGDQITFGISSVGEFMDYDHDGTIDAMSADIIIVTTNGVGVANMSLFTYEISTQTEINTWLFTEAGASVITDGDNRDVVISAWSEGAELSEGEYYTLIVSYGSNEETYYFQAGTMISGSLVTVNVEDQDSLPATGALVDMYYSNDAFTGKPTQTVSSEGIAEFALKIGEYKARVSYMGQTYWSQIFYHPTISEVTVEVGAIGQLMLVHVTSDAGGIQDVTVYSFDSLGRFAGDYGVTNVDGDAYLAVNPGTYVFKVFYLGFNYSSELVTFPTQNETTIHIGGGTVYARVVDGDEVGQANLRVYVFRSTGSYTGLSARTNSTGYAEFTLAEGGYKFRVDYGAARTWSETFGAADGSVITIYIGGKVYAHVIYGPDNEPLDNVRVYLFTASGSYSGINARTNVSGYALFDPVPKDTLYKFRVDYAGGQFWSSEFTGQAAMTIIDINIGGEVYAVVTYGSEDTPLDNVRVYLFRETGSYTGLSARTNETGYARFNGVLGGVSYKFRVDYAGGQYWSSTFIGNSSQLDIVHINIGSTVFAKVMYGPANDTLSNVRVYLFTETGSYTGLSGRTNTTGYAQFDGVLSNTNYKFRVDYAAGQFWSQTFDGSIEKFVVEINIGGIVYANITYSASEDPLDNVRVYLFTAGGSYSGLSARTNSSGLAQFNGVLSTTQYKFRVDYAGGQFWSTEFNGSQSTYVHDVNIGSRVYCYVNDAGIPLNNVRVYLFTENNVYTGLSARTNSTGYAEFNGSLSTVNYKFRVDYSGSQYWSAVFSGALDLHVEAVDVS